MTGALGRVLGASIRIFLADGTADGVWVVEKSNWTGKALMAPRSRYSDLKARRDLDGPGVYVLVGPTESGVPPTRVYIGETDDLRQRLDSHQRSKEFWTRVVVFTSKDDNLNKAHIRYLEARLLELAVAAQRAELENGNAGGLPSLSEPDTAEAEAFLREMLLVYPVLGITAFAPPDEGTSETGSRLQIRGPGASAQGNEVADGFVVYAGALARREVTPSLHRYVTDIREGLVARGFSKGTTTSAFVSLVTSCSRRRLRPPWSSSDEQRMVAASGAHPMAPRSGTCKQLKRRCRTKATTTEATSIPRTHRLLRLLRMPIVWVSVTETSMRIRS